MRIERLVVEVDGGATVALPLHPSLTVVCGLPRGVREALGAELVGCLGPSSDGVHVELVEDSGRRLAVFRPAGARHRVVDGASGSDLSDEFPAAEAGQVDVLAAHGLDLSAARRVLRFTSVEMSSAARGEATLRSLSALDQTALWATAARVRTTEEQLLAESETVGAAPEDAALIDRVETMHAEHELAVAALERARQSAFAVGGLAGLCAALVVPIRPVLALPLALIGIAAAMLSVRYQRRSDRTGRAEAQALEEAGASSYLVFQLRRVDGLLGDQQARRRLLELAAEHGAAAAGWAELVGDVSVDFALSHHDQIVRAAQLGEGAPVPAGPPLRAEVDDVPASVVKAIRDRVARLRTLGRDGESFPLLLEEPLVSVDPSMKAGLLELVVEAASETQAVLLTSDEDVASWARLEAMTGALAVLEPTPAPARAPGEGTPVA